MILPYLNVTQKGMIMALVPVVFQVIFIALLGCAFLEADRKLEALEHSRKAMSSLQKMSTELGTSALIVGNINLSNQAQIREIDNSAARFQAADKWLGLSRAEYPELKELVGEIEDVNNSWQWLSDKAKAVICDPLIPPQKRLKFIGRMPLAVSVRGMQLVTRHIEELEDKHQREDPAAMRSIWISLVATLACGFVINTTLSIMLLARITKDMASRLVRVKRNAECLRSGKDLLVQQSGSDEIAALDRSVHQSAAVLAELRRREFAMLDNAADVIFSLDSELQFTACNNAAMREWGFLSRDLLGVSLLEIVTLENNESVKREFELLKTGQSTCGKGKQDGQQASREIEATILGKTGKRQVYLFNIAWSESRQQFFCVAQNITLLKSMQEFRRNFVSMVSHDLRSPLLAVGISLALLQAGKRGDISQSAMNELAQAEEQLDYMKDLINGLLLWDKLQSGSAKPEVEQVQADELCNQVVENLRSAFKQAGVRVRQLVGSLPLKADTGALNDVLNILLKNLLRKSVEGAVITVYGDDSGAPITFRAVCENRKKEGSARRESSAMLQTVEMSIVEALVDRQKGQLLVKPIEGCEEFAFSIPKELNSDV